MSGRTSRPCRASGPYLPIGKIDWECSTHQVELDRDAALMDQHHSLGGWSCPVTGDPVAVPDPAKQAKAARRRANRRPRTLRRGAVPRSMVSLG